MDTFDGKSVRREVQGLLHFLTPEEAIVIIEMRRDAQMVMATRYHGDRKLVAKLTKLYDAYESARKELVRQEERKAQAKGLRLMVDDINTKLLAHNSNFPKGDPNSPATWQAVDGWEIQRGQLWDIMKDLESQIAVLENNS